MIQTRPLTPHGKVRWLPVTAMLMALNIALSSFGVPVPGGHLYLNDMASRQWSFPSAPTGPSGTGGWPARRWAGPSAL